MPRRSSLKAPPLRPPSPGQQISGKFNSRAPYDSVKGSESQARIQRRMQQDEHSFRRSARHIARRGPPMGQMQFGSSELVYVPMMPNEMQSRGANKDSQRLGDYLANKSEYTSRDGQSTITTNTVLYRQISLQPRRVQQRCPPRARPP